MINYGVIIVRDKRYLLAGFGELTKKKYLIKQDKNGEYIIFNMKKEYIQ